jgi:acetyl-CoA carboxylase biotin carboxylase subunit
VIRRLLIANRGEIARRVVRACRGLGIESVAVFSEADRDAPFVSEADQAVCIGPARAAQSYLDMEAVLAAAEISEAQGVHPGYGFLSENAIFATMVRQQRLIWVGPPPRVIRWMGEKAQAKAAVRAAGLPLIPGSDGVLGSVEEAAALAASIGYPVLLKADAGGGGRGMRKAWDEAGLRVAWEEARREAEAAFGNPALYLEKLLDDARHVEFQVLADSWGNAVHLFERECSVQRRHQKLLEEAPSTALGDAQRHEMGARVAAAVLAVGYEGAGTVEFLQDRRTGELHFIEMNTRIQVEHPVTEEVTGIDLVQAQIRVACGERLWFRQEDVRLNGHAIELRLNAEDPDAGFRPDPGHLRAFELPGAGEFGEGPKGVAATDPAAPRLRLDAAVVAGSRISPFYDSLVAKLIAWAPDRAGAVTAARAALDAMVMEGVKTTAPLQRAILDSEDFRAGRLRVGVIPGREDLSEIPGA